MFIEFCLAGPEDWQWFKEVALIKQSVPGTIPKMIILVIGALTYNYRWGNQGLGRHTCPTH